MKKSGAHIVKERPGRSFRFTCGPSEIPLAEELLRAQGFEFEAEPFSPLCRRAVNRPLPLGSSLAAYFGLIYIQDRSSMLPPLALAPKPGAAVLDMCASPGGKTGFLAQLAGPGGFVLANEPAPDRLETLRRNLARTCAASVVTCCYPGQRLPLDDGCFDYILCDAPCSGWGTAEKNPKALTIWREDKVAPLISLQRALLAEAARLLAPGGRLLYSTCTTNPAENEEQTRKLLGATELTLSPLAEPPGFAFLKPARADLEGVLRVDGEASKAQGFYLAAFVKPGPGATGATGRDAQGGGFSGCEPPGLDLPGADLSRLPPGLAQRFDHRLFYLPRRAYDFLPDRLKYRGCQLGAFSGNSARVHARARLLLPDYSPGCGFNAETPETLVKLISGQSLETTLDLPRPGLYFRGLRLGFLTRKGPRLLWSDR
ncbi:MAG: RsmB/NOP family class I SAM-dependent RNA methyltransferase [Desulfovibrionaceae bacterium]|nr:RsmB/NOP family class I SAM-dependent RNA methyltransferase [Desulfovibrionaceae bacterium]MBF0513291.1 RsmB/NOP family class I SAM-dependent RNA methyltransferase [Desulfovibrionaceae bacterium]